ncbi:hypothetical protein Ddc_24830 [Ditylenchus destructor]|nr:hypothetical protein Ddc_24830 [Ditylenchus destructor]
MVRMKKGPLNPLAGITTPHAPRLQQLTPPAADSATGSAPRHPIFSSPRSPRERPRAAAAQRGLLKNLADVDARRRHPPFRCASDIGAGGDVHGDHDCATSITGAPVSVTS